MGVSFVRVVANDRLCPVINGTDAILPGGHALGSAYEVLYEPDGLISQASADGQPLIFVGINYRLSCKSSI